MITREKLVAPVTDDKRRRGWTARTDFQKWIKPLLDARAADGKWPATYQDLREELRERGVDVKETYIYKLVRGNPAVYATNQRPGYELALAIGQVFGDVEGVLKACGYTPASQPVSTRDGEERVISGMSLQLLDLFEGMREPSRAATLGVAHALLESESDRSRDGGILAPGQIIIADARDQLDNPIARRHPRRVTRPAADRGTDDPGISPSASSANVKDNPA